MLAPISYKDRTNCPAQKLQTKDELYINGKAIVLSLQYDLQHSRRREEGYKGSTTK